MTELSQYKDEALISKTTCEYGSELSPFYKLFPNAVDQPVVMSKNIRTKEVYTSYSETGQSVITSIYSFNFGSQKYPESYHYITTYKFDGSESVDSGFVRFEYY